jgi:hypothetical protein
MPPGWKRNLEGKPLQATITRVLVGRGLRSVADGFVALLLPVHLSRLGYGAVEVGLLATATLLDWAMRVTASGCGRGCLGQHF